MYYEYFGLTEDPFLLTPDPKYTFLSQRHHEVMARLMHDVTERGGLVQLTGEAGTGKTTLCSNLQVLLPGELNIALISNPRQLVASLCDALHVSYPARCSTKVQVDRLNSYLLESHAAGRHTILIIDEAQNLGFEALEQLRMLTNLETATRKLLGIILVGQPELHSLLGQPKLYQLAQRITARYHLTPLHKADTQAYVHHRLGVAGSQRPLFTVNALRRLHKLTGGVPRLINVLCGRSLLAAYGKGLDSIDQRLLSQVAKELTGRDRRMPEHTRWAWGLAGLLSIALSLTAWRILDPESLPEPMRQLLSLSASIPAISSAPPTTRETSRPAPVAKPPAIAARSATTESASTSSPEAESAIIIPSATPVVVTPDLASEADSRPPPAQPKETTEPITISEPNVLTTSRIESVEGTSPQQQIASPAAEISALPATVPEPVAQTIDNALSLVGVHDDIANAFATLFGYWQSDYPLEGEGSACEKAVRIGLQCLYGRGNWDNLHFYNRPAVIELLLDRGKRYHVVVSALEAEQVTLDFGTRQAKLSKGELESIWSGSYIVLWRPPELVNEQLRPNSQGVAVHWLREMLEQVDGQPAGRPDDPAQTRFDWQLAERVMAFQRSAGLVGDGIVGRQTLIKLNAAVNNPQIPVLDKRLQTTARRIQPVPPLLDEASHLTKLQPVTADNPPASKPQRPIKPAPAASPDKTILPLELEAVTQPAPKPNIPAQTVPPELIDAKIPAEFTLKDTLVPVESAEPTQPSSKPAESLSSTAAETTKIDAPVELEASASEPVLAQLTPAVTTERVTEPEELIPRLKDLPKAVQKLFVDLEIIIHFYHEIPEARFIMIGKHRYREGDVLDRQGFKLVRITRRWVIIDYGNGRVRL